MGAGEDGRPAAAERAPFAGRLSLGANFTWTFLGSLAYSACQWGMLVVLAKLGTAAMVGDFTLGLALAAPVLMLTNLQLRSVQATDARREYSFGDYLGLRLLMTLLALVVVGMLTLISGYDANTVAVVLLVGLAKAFESISDIFYGLFQQHERMDRIARSLLAKGVLALAALGLGVWLGGSLWWGVLGLTAAWGLVLLVHDLPAAAWLLPGGGLPRPRWQPRSLARLVWLALPLGAVMCLISLTANLPRYFLHSWCGSAELGIFAAISYLMLVGGRFVNAFGEAASPRLARSYAEGDLPGFRRLLLRQVGLAVLFGSAGLVVSLVAGRQLLTLLYRAEYAEHTDLLMWVMVAAALTYLGSALGYAMTAARYFRVQMPLFVLVCATTAGACALLVPQYQLLGAAWAVVLALTLQVLGSLGIIGHALRTLARERR